MTSTLSFPNPGAWLAILGLFVLSVPGVAWGAIEPGDPPRPPHAEVTPRKPLTGRQPLTVVFAPDVPLRATFRRSPRPSPRKAATSSSRSKTSSRRRVATWASGSS